MTKQEAINELTRAAELCPTTPLAEACRMAVDVLSATIDDKSPHDCINCRHKDRTPGVYPCSQCEQRYSGVPSKWEPTMGRLIELDAAIKATWKDTGYTDPLNVMTAIRDRLEALPTVDAVPVRHGRWREDTGGYGFWICSHCGFVSEASAADLLYRYCPNCGARMDGEHEKAG